MKTRCKAIILALLLFAAVLPAATDSIVVINKTGYDIYYLQISPSDSEEWGEDVLGDDVLMNDSSIKLSTDGFDSCLLDISATDNEDDSYIKWEFDSCEKSKVVLTIDDLYIEDLDFSIQDFTIINNTGFDIHYIYISPDYSDEWEEDILGEEEILYADQAYDVSFSGYGDQCSFDVRLVDDEGDTYTKWGVDLCSIYDLSISLDDLDY